MKCFSAANVLLLVSALCANAKADPIADLPDLPHPATLPELTHRFVEISTESTFASVSLTQNSATAATDTRAHANIQIQKWNLEVPLLPRRWFVGTSYAFAVGTVPSGGNVAVTGNPEVYIRGVWATVTGIAFGGGFAFVAPTRSWDDRGQAISVASSASAARGWDRAVFDPNSLTSRAFIDMRNAVGPLIIQYRQALEVADDTRNINRYTLAAVGTLYAAVQIGPRVAIGTELVEYYSLEPDVSDFARVHWSLGADVRIKTRYFQPMLGLMTSLGSPLRAISSFGAPLGSSPESFTSLRIGLAFVFDRSEEKKK